MSRTSDRTYLRNREHVRRTQDTCHLCGQWIDPDLTYPDPYSFSADHIVPLARGGPNRGALTATHLVCNKRRGAKPLHHVQPNHGRQW